MGIRDNELVSPNGDRRPSHAWVQTFVKVMTGQYRWTLLLGVGFMAYWAASDARHHRWLWFALSLVMAGLGGVGLLVHLVVHRRDRLFALLSAEEEGLPPLLSAGMAGVKIRREPATVGAAVRYTVWIDGHEVGTVALGEIRLFEVQPGTHQVGVGIRRRRREDREWGVHLQSGEVGDFVCRSGWDGFIELAPVD